VFADVTAGDYDLDVTLPGFRRNQRAVQIASGQRLTTRIQLQLGSLAEEITVTGRPGEAISPGGQMPASFQTAADYLAAARFYYDREAFSDADAMIARVLELTQASQPQLTAFPDTPGVVRVGGSSASRERMRRPADLSVCSLRSGAEGVVTMEAIIARDGRFARRDHLDPHPLR
jgi:hypothetical protein